MDRTKQVARVAAYSGGGLVFAGAAVVGLLLGQAFLARHTIQRAEAPPPRCDGRYGRFSGKRAVTLALLGDSTGAGYGVHHARETPGALLGAGLAERLGRPVDVRCFAVPGAKSAMLAPQVEAAIEVRPDITVILIGGNDVTHRVSNSIAVRHLVTAVRALRAVGSKVVVGTCPDLGTIEPIQQPLRWLARRWSRDLATAQTIAVVEAGGSTVSLGDLLGPAFAAEPQRMFSSDRFHPSADGYAAAAAALLPTVAAAVGAEPETRPSLARGEGVRSLPQAAAEAAGRAGTEVSGATVGGRERGPAGRWAQLRNRVRQAIRPMDPFVNGATVSSMVERAHAFLKQSTVERR